MQMTILIRFNWSSFNIYSLWLCTSHRPAMTHTHTLSKLKENLMYICCLVCVVLNLNISIKLKYFVLVSFLTHSLYDNRHTYYCRRDDDGYNIYFYRYKKFETVHLVTWIYLLTSMNEWIEKERKKINCHCIQCWLVSHGWLLK